MEKFISKYNKFEKKILKRIKLRKVFNINTVYGRRHLKLFTNCHVSWDTLYLINSLLIVFIRSTHIDLDCYEKLN